MWVEICKRTLKNEKKCKPISVGLFSLSGKIE